MIERVKETREKDERILIDLSSTTLKRIDVKNLERNEGLCEENRNIICLFLREKKKEKKEKYITLNVVNTTLQLMYGTFLSHK